MNLKNTVHSILTEDDIIEYILDMFEKLKKDATTNGLVIFHTNNKFLLMCHEQNKLRILGNIVANRKNFSLSEMVHEYEIHLKDTLFTRPTTKRHINALMHILGHFSSELNRMQKELFLNFVEQFRDGKITLGTMLWEIEPLIRRYDKTYLAGQTYFSLYAEKRHPRSEPC